MESKKAILEIEDLWVSYTSAGETSHAVNGICLSLNEGETLGLVGETGAGKTTTALSIMRLLPSMGRVSHMKAKAIRFHGRDLMQCKEAEMRMIRGALISMIFQDPMSSLNPVLTVGEQIAEAIRLHNPELSKHDVSAKVEEMLLMVNIPPERKNEYPHQFSGGMKQRVIIAIALSCRPQIIIADEPTTALDVTIQAQVLAMIAQLRRQLNTSMILITHDLGVVAETCDAVAVMYAGEIVEYGTVEDIFEGKYHHPYTEGLFNSLPDLEKETARLKPINGLMPDPTNLPQGCKFHPRCPYCTDICKQKQPSEYVCGTQSIRCNRIANILEEKEGKEGE